MKRVTRALDQIVFTRNYSTELIDTIPERDWFRTPSEGITHVAWQVAHLAFAEYRILLLRCRGPQPGDEQLIPEHFRNRYGANSVPALDPKENLTVDEISNVFKNVHERVLEELVQIEDARFDDPITPPHPICKTKADCLWWAPAHEMLHVGQIGLLRRLLGHKPMW